MSDKFSVLRAGNVVLATNLPEVAADAMVSTHHGAWKVNDGPESSCDGIMGLEAFIDRHGDVIENALAVYIEHMRESAEDCQAAYLGIKDDPEKRAAQDKTLITTNGLKHSALALGEAADRAQAALNACRVLAGDVDE